MKCGEVEVRGGPGRPLRAADTLARTSERWTFASRRNDRGRRVPRGSAGQEVAVLKSATFALTAAGVYLVVRRRRRRARAAREHPLDPLAVVPSVDPDDLLGVVRSTHDRLQRMADILSDLPTVDREDRGRATDAMREWVAATVQHEAADELELWPLVRDRLPGGDALAQRASEEQLSLRRSLQRLWHRQAGDVDWDHLLEISTRAAYDLMVFEQVEAWPSLSRELGDRERGQLGRAWTAARDAAPTRPHLEPAPGRRRRLSGVLAALDRAGDRASGRRHP